MAERIRWARLDGSVFETILHRSNCELDHIAQDAPKGG